jgi:hypothetical protein
MLIAYLLLQFELSVIEGIKALNEALPSSPEPAMEEAGPLDVAPGVLDSLSLEWFRLLEL